MSTNYTSSPTATQAPAPTPAVDALPIVVIPADGDALNAASITQALKVLADFSGWATTKLLPWTGAKSLAKLLVDGTGNAAVSLVSGFIAEFVGGAVAFEGTVADETKPALYTVHNPSSFKLLWKVKLSSTLYGRIYAYPAGWYFTVGAEWDGSNWALDSGVVTAYAVIVQTSGIQVAYMTGSSWLQAALITSSSLSFTNGSVSATTTVAAGTAVTAGTTVTGGTGVTATTGDLTASAGNLKARHLVGNGSTPGSGTPGSVDPAFTGTNTIVGTDMGGIVTMVVASGNNTTAGSGGKIFTVPFASTYTNPPAVTLNSITGAAALLGFVVDNVTATSFDVIDQSAGGKSVLAGTSYKWAYTVIGR